MKVDSEFVMGGVRTLPDATGTLQLTPTQTGLIVLSLACCIACIWMVFSFGRRIQTSAYLRGSLIAAAEAEELRILLRDLNDLRDEGVLDQSSPPPPGFERDARLIWRGDLKQSRRTEPYIPSSASEEQRAQIKNEFEEDQKQRAIKNEPFFRWIDEERNRYAIMRKNAETEARRRAESRVPQSLDISLLGGGWSFILEFSTVIVIIFVLLCLGIMNTVTGKDLTTILASIAGYVLGKASTAGKQSTGTDVSIPPPKR